MRKLTTVLLFLTLLTPAFVGNLSLKLDKKLRKDPNVIKVVTEHVDLLGPDSYDALTVYVQSCYNRPSMHRIPTVYKNTPVRIHCIVPAQSGIN